MRPIEMPKLVADVIRRRIGLAPREIRVQAFGSAATKAIVFDGDTTTVVMIGSAVYLRQSETRNRKYGHPLFGAVKFGGFPERAAISVSGTGVIIDRCVAEGSGLVEFSGRSSALIVNSSFSVHSSLGDFDYHVEGAALIGETPQSTWVAEQLDLILVRYISSYVVEVRDAS